jgi:4-methyl-5(b-hydroxyethyl)-thiazole monophosphate biosynthesis
MAKVYVFLADGFEEIEALIPIDVLRRGGVNVVTVSISKTLTVESLSGIKMKADILFNQGDYTDADLLMLPGGKPGAANLMSCSGLRKALLSQFAAGKMISAICASPAVVLAPLGILKNRQATCYPAPPFFNVLIENGANYTGDEVAVDGNIITAGGAASSFLYAFEILSQLTSKENAQKIAEAIRYNQPKKK